MSAVETEEYKMSRKQENIVFDYKILTHVDAKKMRIAKN